MKTILLFLALLLPCRGVEFDFGSISDADIRATVEHLQRLAKDAQQESAQAKQEIARLDRMIFQLTDNLQSAQNAAKDAAVETAKVQKGIDALREWGIAQEKEKHAAQTLASQRGWHELWLAGALLGCLLWIFRKPLLTLL